MSSPEQKSDSPERKSDSPEQKLDSNGQKPGSPDRTLYNLERSLYSAILRLQPTDFHAEFGHEMLCDFEDARHELGFAPLMADACLSLARQWKSRLLTWREPEPQPEIAGHPFLSGQYCIIRQGSSLSAFDLARASMLSLLLFLMIGFVATRPNRHAIGEPHSQQVSHGGADGSVKSASPAAADSSHRVRANAWDPEIGGTGTPGHHTQSPIRLRPPALGLRIRLQAHGYPTGGTLKGLIWQLTLISVIIWLTSFFFIRTSGIAKRLVLAAIGLLGIAATATYAQIPAPATHAQILHAADSRLTENQKTSE
jgi:hypothetical protein